MADQIDELQSLYMQLQTAQDYKQKAEVDRLSQEIISRIDSFPPLEHLPKPQRARILLYKGKALSAQDTYDKQAEDALTRSVKLDPTKTSKRAIAKINIFFSLLILFRISSLLLHIF